MSLSETGSIRITRGGVKQGRLLTPTFVMAWLVNFSGMLVFYILVTTMALYATAQFLASDAAGGFASSSFVVGATAARLAAGYLVDGFGRRRILLIALAVAVVACAAYLPIDSLPVLIVARLVHGFAYAFVSTAVMTIAQGAIPPDRRAEGTGYFALGPTLATAVGPALGLLLVNEFSYSMMFWVALAVSILGLVLAVFLPDPAGAAHADAGPRAKFSLREIAHPAVVPIGFFMLLVGLCYAGVITYMNAYAHERDVAVGASLFFVAYAVVMLLMRFLLGRVQDSHGDNAVVYLGLASFAVALALLATATGDVQVIIAGALTGLGYGTLMPASQAIAVRVVPPHKLGTGISTLLVLTDIGVGLGPIALGLLVSQIGYGAMYGVLAGVVVLTSVYYAFAHGRRHGRRVR